jgi:hypothetical protein
VYEPDFEAKHAKKEENLKDFLSLLIDRSSNQGRKL